MWSAARQGEGEGGRGKEGRREGKSECKCSQRGVWEEGKTRLEKIQEREGEREREVWELK